MYNLNGCRNKIYELNTLLVSLLNHCPEAHFGLKGL